MGTSDWCSIWQEWWVSGQAGAAILVASFWFFWEFWNLDFDVKYLNLQILALNEKDVNILWQPNKKVCDLVGSWTAMFLTSDGHSNLGVSSVWFPFILFEESWLLLLSGPNGDLVMSWWVSPWLCPGSPLISCFRGFLLGSMLCNPGQGKAYVHISQSALRCLLILDRGDGLQLLQPVPIMGGGGGWRGKEREGEQVEAQKLFYPPVCLWSVKCSLLHIGRLVLKIYLNEWSVSPRATFFLSVMEQLLVLTCGLWSSSSYEARYQPWWMIVAERQSPHSGKTNLQQGTNPSPERGLCPDKFLQFYHKTKRKTNTFSKTFSASHDEWVSRMLEHSLTAWWKLCSKS